MLDPGAPDFAGGHRHRGFALDALNLAYEFVNGLLAAIDSLIADDDAIDIAVFAGEIDHRAHFAVVAAGVLVDPGADRNAGPELAGDLGAEFCPSGRRVGADHPGEGGNSLQIGSDLFPTRSPAAVGMGGSVKRCVGDAGELTIEGGSATHVARHGPHTGMNASDKNADKSDDAHQSDQAGLRTS